MSSNKKVDTFDELDKPYEPNVVGLKGVIYFGIGLFLLIVITFGLMFAFLNVLRDYNEENKGPADPMAMSDKEHLPPEPRLQLAPGFGIDTNDGRVNLELNESQAEYRVFHKEWLDMWAHGMKDAKTGTVTMLPIEEAKQKLLASGVKAKSDPDSAKMLDQSRKYFSQASAGAPRVRNAPIGD